MDFQVLLENFKERMGEREIRVLPGRYLADCPAAEDSVPELCVKCLQTSPVMN